MAEKEYIERDAEIEHLEKLMQLQASTARAIINAIPAADVLPVVLCRDCKRYFGRPWKNNENGICTRTDCGVVEDDFCSYGEKREES